MPRSHLQIVLPVQTGKQIIMIFMIKMGIILRQGMMEMETGLVMTGKRMFLAIKA